MFKWENSIGEDFITRRFKTGEICEVVVPDEYKDTHDVFQGATVEIFSKKKYKLAHPKAKVPSQKIVIKIIKAPNAPHPETIIGVTYPLRRSWLISDGRHRCKCDLKTILMISGCTCGGV